MCFMQCFHGILLLFLMFVLLISTKIGTLIVGFGVWGALDSWVSPYESKGFVGTSPFAPTNGEKLAVVHSAEVFELQ